VARLNSSSTPNVSGGAMIVEAVVNIRRESTKGEKLEVKKVY
jgi:hypothetical protein